MPLESFSYISSLVATNPSAADDVPQGDDHLRGIKSTLRASFPNIAGEVTATHTELNALGAGTGPGQIPIGGTIIWWSDTLPSTGGTWLWCNGQTFSAVTYPALNTLLGGNTLPDLRDNVPVGTGDMGGTVSPARITTVNTGPLQTQFGAETVTLTTSHMPQHSHTLSSGNAPIASGGAHTPTGSANSNGSHTHTGTTSAGSSHSHSYATASDLVDGVAAGAGFNDVWRGSSSTNTDSESSHTHTFTSSSDGAHTHTLTMDAVAAHTHTISGSTDNAGSGSAHSNLQPSLTCNWVIRAL